MRSYVRSCYLLIFLLSLSSLILAASPTSFCKCVCFTNSTIIALDPPAASPTSPAIRNTLVAPRADGANSDDGLDEDNGKDRKEYRAGNCNDCNRQLCLDYNLPICEGAKMEDVFTTCFQRDSRKDEAVVFIFIFATAGLLGWAAVKPWVGKWVESARERRSYIPLPNQADN